MCQQTVLGFCVSLRETASNASTSTVINNFCKGVVLQIAKDCRPICLVVFLMLLWKRVFGHLSNHISRKQLFRKHISYDGLVFFGKCLRFNIYFRNAKKKIRENFFVFEIIASELVAPNCLC